MTLLTFAAPLTAQSRLASDPALAGMVAADRAFAAAALDSTPQRAFLRWFAADALIYRPRLVRAAEYLRARPMPRGLSLVWEPVFADVSAAGDLGYTSGPWISQRRDVPGADPTFGQYVTIWRRQADRSWKVELHAGIAHGADAIGPKDLRVAPSPDWRVAGTAAARAAAADANRLLLQADAALARVSQARGAAAAFRSRSAPHLRLLRSGELAATGNEAHGLLSTVVTYRWQPAGGNVASSGDLGYTWGTFVSITGPAAARINERGDYLRVWRRRADGEWVVVLDLTSPLP
jgi:ketosteroid isomerase-like protein